MKAFIDWLVPAHASTRVAWGEVVLVLVAIALSAALVTFSWSVATAQALR